MACFKLGSGFHFDACQVLKRHGRWMMATLLVLVDERMFGPRWWIQASFDGSMCLPNSYVLMAVLLHLPRHHLAMGLHCVVRSFGQHREPQARPPGFESSAQRIFAQK